MNLRDGAIQVLNVAEKGERKSIRKDLRSLKKEAISDCKSLKGKSRRKCKKGVRKNYRTSKNNTIRGGETWVGKTVKNIGSIAAPLTSIVGGLVPGGSAIASVLTSITGSKPKQQNKTVVGKSTKLGNFIGESGAEIGSILGGIFGKKQEKGATPEQKPEKPNENKMQEIIEKVKTFFTTTAGKVTLAVSVVGVGVLLYRKFRKKSGGKKF